MIALVDDDEWEGLFLNNSARFQALLEKSRRSIRAGKGLTHKDFWKAVARRHPMRLDNHLRKTSKSSA